MGVHQYTKAYISIHGYTQVYTSIHQYTQVYTSIHGYTQVYMDTVQLKGNVASARDFLSSDRLVSIESRDRVLATRLVIQIWQETYEWRSSHRLIDEAASIICHVHSKLHVDMPQLSVASRKRVIYLKRQGYSLQVIRQRLSKERNMVSLRSLQRLWSKFQKVHTVRDLPRATRPRLLTAEMVSVLEDCLRNDDEMTARKLKTKLGENFNNFPNVSLATIKRNHKECGWVCTRPHYCQLIRDANKGKRKEWCQHQLDNDEQFENIVFTDECTVQLDHHGRLCFRKEKAPRILKQRAKHLAKIHIWGGYIYARSNPFDYV